MRLAGLLAVLGLLAAAPPASGQRVGFEVVDFPFELEQPPRQITGPVDQRFFGTYCQPAPKEFCKSVAVLFEKCVTLRDMRVDLEHLTARSGGLLRGGGRFVLDGKQGAMSIAGTVLRRGRARVTVVAPGVQTVVGADLRLSESGLVAVVSVQSRSFALRKDACGNGAPQVTLTTPFGPTFPFGKSVKLVGNIADEDTAFPERRMVFTSDRQGLLLGTRTGGGRTLFASSLQPGSHRITLTVTDSGGLTGQGSLDVAIVNRPPETPRIFLPAEGATLVAEAPVLLQGNALDPETGFLSGGALAWSAQVEPGGPFLPIGVGSELGTIFPAPADPVLIRLTATDPTGLTAQAERQVQVIANAGNAPPVVVIKLPDRLRVNGSPVASYFTGLPANFLAAASDVEDALPDLELKWEFVALTGPGGGADPAPAVPNPAPVTGSLAAEVVFPIGTSGFYRATFQATDRGGLTTSESVEIFVQGAVL